MSPPGTPTGTSADALTFSTFRGALGLVVIITSVTILVRPGASAGSDHLPPAVTRTRSQDAASVPAAPSAAGSPGTAHGDGHAGAPPA